jgi:hypothetical protein
MSDHPAEKDYQVGAFFVENGIITKEQLDEALLLQQDNKERLVGEILVTLGVFTKSDLIMALEMFLMLNDRDVEHVDEWLDQDEVDLLIDKIKEKGSSPEK